MILGTLTRILKEDLNRYGSVPDWVDAMLTPLNQFMSQVALALNKNLNFEDNFKCKKTTLTVTSGVELSIDVGSQKVTGVLPLLAKNQTIDRWGARLKQDSSIGVTVHFGGSAIDGQTKAELTILILF